MGDAVTGLLARFDVVTGEEQWRRATVEPAVAVDVDADETAGYVVAAVNEGPCSRSTWPPARS